MLVTAVALGVGSCILGLFLSYYAAAASGATIVLVATVAFFVLFVAGRRFRRALASR
jgi:ABC-type Mn2+/Zn2+ transport system permease subunit